MNITNKIKGKLRLQLKKFVCTPTKRVELYFVWQHAVSPLLPFLVVNQSHHYVIDHQRACVHTYQLDWIVTYPSRDPCMVLTVSLFKIQCLEKMTQVLVMVKMKRQVAAKKCKN